MFTQWMEILRQIVDRDVPIVSANITIILDCCCCERKSVTKCEMRHVSIVSYLDVKEVVCVHVNVLRL